MVQVIDFPVQLLIDLLEPVIVNPEQEFSETSPDLYYTIYLDSGSSAAA